MHNLGHQVRALPAFEPKYPPIPMRSSAAQLAQIAQRKTKAAPPSFREVLCGADPYQVVASFVDLGMEITEIARYFRVDPAEVAQYQRRLQVFAR